MILDPLLDLFDFKKLYNVEEETKASKQQQDVSTATSCISNIMNEKNNYYASIVEELLSKIEFEQSRRILQGLDFFAPEKPISTSFSQFDYLLSKSHQQEPQQFDRNKLTSTRSLRYKLSLKRSTSSTLTKKRQTFSFQ